MIVLGLAAGLLANMLIPGKRSQGLIITCVTGIAGALPGGWAATWLFHIHTLHGFFNLSTWLTAIAGAAALLLAYHLVTGPSGRRVPSCRHRDLWRRRPAGPIGRGAGSRGAPRPRALASSARAGCRSWYGGGGGAAPARPGCSAPAVLRP